MKKIGGVFAFKVKDGPGGKEQTWVVDVKNGKGCVDVNSGQCLFSFSIIKFSLVFLNKRDTVLQVWCKIGIGIRRHWVN